jgi:hypothetical protein
MQLLQRKQKECGCYKRKECSCCKEKAFSSYKKEMKLPQKKKNAVAKTGNEEMEVKQQ